MSYGVQIFRLITEMWTVKIQNPQLPKALLHENNFSWRNKKNIIFFFFFKKKQKKNKKHITKWTCSEDPDQTAHLHEKNVSHKAPQSVTHNALLCYSRNGVKGPLQHKKKQILTLILKIVFWNILVMGIHSIWRIHGMPLWEQICLFVLCGVLQPSQHC